MQPHYHVKDLTDYAAAFAPLLAVLVAVGVALMQYYLQRQQLKQQMFAKRFAVYSAVRRFLSAALKSYDPLENTEYEAFVFETRPARFLFGPDVVAFITNIKASIRHVGDADGNFVRRLEINDPESERDPLTAIMRWGYRAEVVFSPDLQLNEEQGRLSQCKARIDQWIDSEDDRMRSRYNS